MKPAYLLIFSVLLAAGLSLPGITVHPFWDDEANTAIIGRNFTATGTLTAWDGRNLLSYSMGGAFDGEMKKDAPPLQYLLAGASMALFGETTVGGRMLFWLIGLMTIPLAALWYRNSFGQRDYWVVGFVLALTVAYLLFIRQARYFGPALTFFFGLLWCWSAVAQSKRPRVWIAVGLGFAVLLALTHYLSALAAGVVILLSLLNKPIRNRDNLIFLSALCVVGFMLVLWFMAGGRGTAPQGFGDPISFQGRLIRAFNLFMMSQRDVVRFELVPIGVLLFCLPAIAVLRRGAFPYLRQIGMLLIYSYGVLLSVSVFNPQPFASTDSDTHVRYYIALIPIWAVLAGVIFEMLRAAGLRLLAPLFLVILLSSNLLTFNFLGAAGWHGRIAQYVKENFGDSTTGTAAVSRYIEEKVGPDECIFMVPLYTAVEQMFYHPAHKFCGMVSEKARFVETNRSGLREDLFFEKAIPDVFIVGRWSDDAFARYLDEAYGPGSYDLVEMLPVYWRNATRPEMLWRSFGPVDVGVSSKNRILIFRRTGAPVHYPRVDALETGRRFMY